MLDVPDGEKAVPAKIPRAMSFLPTDINPFVHRIHLTRWDKIKMGVMSVTVVPIRLLLVFICLSFAWLNATIAMAGLSDDDLKEPMKGWRRWMQGVQTFLGKAVMFCCGFYSVKIIGNRADAKDAPLICCAPHSSFFDTVLILLLRTSGLSRVENSRIFLLGALTRFTQPVLVSREDPASRQNTIQEIERRAKSGGKWPQIIIFPEGTCTNRSCLIAFKPGAFYPGMPVQPVCLRYKNKLDTTTWTWDGPKALKLLWFTLCQFSNKLELEFLDVHVPNEEELADPKLFAKNVRDEMAECLGIPTTDHTFEDCRLMLYAQKIDFPAAAGLVEFHKLGKSLGIKYENIQDYLKKFTKIAQTNKNAVTVEELANFLELPLTEAVKDMFSLYDRNGNGTIDFREYVIGLHLVAEPANSEATLKFAFEVFDTGNKGYITKDELCEVLNKAFSMDEEAALKVFKEADTDSDNTVNFEEFRNYAAQRPEYAKLFLTYHEMQSTNVGSKQDIAIDNQASKILEKALSRAQSVSSQSKALDAAHSKTLDVPHIETLLVPDEAVLDASQRKHLEASYSKMLDDCHTKAEEACHSMVIIPDEVDVDDLFLVTKKSRGRI